uniref:putative uncharacterized protein DDB_G0277255 n=1 Tax=Erigeron canadensis TaxID=72917 RepID=UPI001CB958D7|nr:putative uncharacterized protein DDB_G0277255 [Erigeron canadensis]
MSGRSSAGRGLTSRGRGRGRGRHNSISRGNNGSNNNASPNLSHANTNNDTGRGRHNSMARGNNGRNNGSPNVSHDGTNNDTGRGQHNSIARGNNDSNSNASPHVSDDTNSEHMDQFDELPSYNREIGSPSSQAEGSNAPHHFVADPNKIQISITPDQAHFTRSNDQADNGQITRYIIDYRDLAYEKAEENGNPVTEDDISAIIPYKPSWMKQEYWTELVTDHWNKEGWLKTSKANKANRAKFVSSYHCKKKRSPTIVFGLSNCITYEKGEGEDEVEVEGEGGNDTSAEPLVSSIDPTKLIDDRARQAVERLSEYMRDKYGPDLSQHPKHDQELYERATGSRKKGRLYGCGSSSDPSFVLTGTPSGNSGNSYVPPGEDVEKLQQKLDEVLEAQEKARRDMEEREARMVEAHEKAQREMAEREERLKRELEERLAEILKNIPNLPK